MQTMNGTESYVRAYNCVAAKRTTVSRRAYALMRNAQVISYISALQQESNKKSEIKKERAIRELANIVNVRINDVVKQVSSKSFIVRSIDSLPDEVAATIKSIKHTQYGIEVVLYDKINAITSLSKLLGWDAPIKTEQAINARIIIGDELNNELHNKQ